ncbi:TetR family transcriptional regulator [Arthrobacter sp. NPDC089319]|uniref:acyl-CoA-like ligand-binding transcription factor n=1 Tax=Arthrobacter sp. NPDC089319 TaxID=3155915 RepID=UPI003420802E
MAKASTGADPRGRGRPATVSPDAVAAVGLEMFMRDGFEATTMTEIALAAGIARKTLFTYFPTKADIVWNRFQDQLADVRQALENTSNDVETVDAIVAAVMRGLHMAPQEVPIVRAEVTLIRDTEVLQSYSYMQGAPWREALARFIAEREGLEYDGVLPQVLAHGFWQAMFVAHRQWLDSDDPAPAAHIESALVEFADAVRGAFPPRT